MLRTSNKSQGSSVVACSLLYFHRPYQALRIKYIICVLPFSMISNNRATCLETRYQTVYLMGTLAFHLLMERHSSLMSYMMYSYTT